MSLLAALPERYRLILCDLWGVVHDGYSLYPGAAERLRQWRSEKRFVVLITNAPRGVEAVEEHLAQVGLPRDCWDAIVSGGEAGIAAINALGEEVGFLGTKADRDILERKGVRIRDDDGFGELACTGLEERRLEVEDYRTDLDRWAARGVRMHCLNPDRIVVRGGAMELCAGSLADAYEAVGGTVKWYGKPFPAIYEHALSQGGNPPKDQVLAIGDGLQTDVLGAANAGIDCVFVQGGIHAGGAFPSDFSERYGLGDWQPVAIVPGLGA